MCVKGWLSDRDREDGSRTDVPAKSRTVETSFSMALSEILDAMLYIDTCYNTLRSLASL